MGFQDEKSEERRIVLVLHMCGKDTF